MEREGFARKRTRKKSLLFDLKRLESLSASVFTNSRSAISSEPAFALDGES